MCLHAPAKGDLGVNELRSAAGAWLRQLREARGLTQRELADLVGIRFYTFISALEAGRGRIAPGRYGDWAKALNMDPQSFARTLIRYYEPSIHNQLFAGAA